jgi:hypothetical protein
MSLTLFKNITSELTDYEKKTLVPMLLESLQNTHTCFRIKGRTLCEYFNACRIDVSDVRIRKMVNYIRVMNLASPKVLIGASTGYFLTDIIAVVDAQIESLQGRVDSMTAAIDALKAQKENLKRQNAH